MGWRHGWKGFPRITGCRVAVEMPHKHQGKVLDIRLDVRVPGEEIVPNSERVRKRAR